MTLLIANRSKTLTFTPGPDATQFTLPAETLRAGDRVLWNVRARIADRTGPASPNLHFLV